jgi:hypothetical protein
MPELPRYHGQMNFGDGPFVLLVEKPGMPEKDIKPGETIGQFKLVDVTTSDITFAWTFNGAVVRRSLDSMIDRSAVAATPASAAADSRSAPPPEPVKSALGAGAMTGFGFKECQANDSSPEGTVDNGYRKILVSNGPFGKSCRWDPVK